jgi:hypothetical protein
LNGANAEESSLFSNFAKTRKKRKMSLSLRKKGGKYEKRRKAKSPYA